MTLIRLNGDRPEIVDDSWTDVADDARLPEAAPAIVSLERWTADRESLAGRNSPVGVRLRSDERIDAVLGDLDVLPVIALDFPSLADGRHFSTARLLRERHGFRGEIRAAGQVLRDQLDLMKRCGFDMFELSAGKDAASAVTAFDEISVAYQPAADARPTAAQLRHRPVERAIAV